jgi:uncharacterized LabA/DUF88 family protein
VGKNVAVFVDVANIFYAAKAAGVDIDYVTMLKSATAGRDLVRAYAYTGLDPDNENQRNFHDFLRRHGYKVVSKDIRKYGDGKVKANLDIELVVDMMKTARNLDVAIVVSGDGDFAPAIRAVQEMGVRVEVISFRGNTSSDLMEVADLFTDIIQIAKVEKGTSRSGRRVATDDEDLSMTEVPDKQTEGTGTGRGRGRGRGRAAEGERIERVAATRAGGRTRGRVAVEAGEAAVPVAGRPAIVALPGEKLSRARIVASAQPAVEAVEAVVEGQDNVTPTGLDTEEGHRRRRRGGRGRGRGRGRGEGVLEGVLEAPEGAPQAGSVDGLDDAIPAAPRAPRPAPFGSVWDSQIGVTRTPGTVRDLPPADEFDDEPAIPEYLIAERRGPGRSGPRPVGGRGARSGYAAAVDRERYGRGGSTGGINRYPDVSARSAGGGRDGRAGYDGGRRDERGSGRPQERHERGDRTGGAPRPGEGWSEVPPELEAMLRAQLAASATAGPAGRRDAGDRTGGSAGSRRRGGSFVAGREGVDRSALAPAGAPATADVPARADVPADGSSATVPTRRRTTRTMPAGAVAVGPTEAAPAADVPAGRSSGALTPKGRAPRAKSPAATEAKSPVAPSPGALAGAAKRRPTRPKAVPDSIGEAGAASGAAAGEATPADGPAATPKRRTTRTKAASGDA